MSILLLWLAACGLDPDRIPEHPVHAGDGAVLQVGDQVRFGVVGSTRPGGASQAVIADVAAVARDRDLAFVVVLGDQVERSTARAWRALSHRWEPVARAGIGLWPLIGPGEVRGDPSRTGWTAAWPQAGARRRPDAGWGTLDLVVGGERWRLLRLETAREAMGERWAEQQFWLPRTVADPAMDHLLVFTPTAAVTAAGTADPAARTVLDALRHHARVEDLVAVVQGGPATHEVHLPGGRWGEAWVVAGNAGVAGGPGAGAGLPDAFVRGVRTVRGDRAGPLVGWWEVGLRGAELELALRLRGDEGFATAATLHHHPDRGWRLEAAGP